MQVAVDVEKQAVRKIEGGDEAWALKMLREERQLLPGVARHKRGEEGRGVEGRERLSEAMQRVGERGVVVDGKGGREVVLELRCAVMDVAAEAVDLRGELRGFSADELC